MSKVKASMSNRKKVKLVDLFNQMNICLMLAIIGQRTQCSKSHRPFRGDTKFTTDYAKAHIKSALITLERIAKMYGGDEICDKIGVTEFIRETLNDPCVRNIYDVIEIVIGGTSELLFDLEYDALSKELMENDEDE